MSGVSGPSRGSFDPFQLKETASPRHLLYLQRAIWEPPVLQYLLIFLLCLWSHSSINSSQQWVLLFPLYHKKIETEGRGTCLKPIAIKQSETQTFLSPPNQIALLEQFGPQHFSPGRKTLLVDSIGSSSPALCSNCDEGKCHLQGLYSLLLVPSCWTVCHVPYSARG